MSKYDWGYTETNGPSTWPSKFPQAAGSRQSPVDVKTTVATSDTSLQSRPLTWYYKPTICKSIVNPGYGWRVDVHNDEHGSELIGGPLGSKYKLEQFHCHWGRDSKSGSEHTVDGKAYSGELHLVHWNCRKYKTFAEAAQHPDGLAVLGVFFEVGEDKHDEVEKIVSLIQHIVYRGEEKEITKNIDPTNLLPKRTHYWTYLGSLTTPPCTESVTWIIFKEPIKVSEEQLAVFRSMRSYSQQEMCPVDEHNGHVLHNFRPPLPLGNRELRECGSG
ncbi:carbonic anhydrase 2-like [Lycorma delicatula]|uniref:carbonic anhydrase 2-like n=1 Tax=Lycorma delicatula TaxID=130591 RepID=UPI003F51380C